VSDAPRLQPGTVGWIDLTVADAPRLRDFYGAVVGWETAPVAMGEYEDWCVLPPGSEVPVGGICHARGGNADLPAAWLVYFVVADLDASLAAARERGGELIGPVRSMGPSRYAELRDPAGAAFALYQHG
jgi:predicted enzyme related to lactoylglutathione lyase